MRKDFKKLLCERPRTAYHSKEVLNETRETQRETHLDYDEWEGGRTRGIKKSRSGKFVATKELNEFLSPLFKFLRQRVGFVWNDVHSEISTSCPKDSAVSAHIWQHLEHTVLTQGNYSIGDDGKIFTIKHSSSDYPNEVVSTEKYPHFYVNNKGILVECNKKQRQKIVDENEKNRRHLIERDLGFSKEKNCDLWAVKIGGRWFEAKMGIFTPDKKSFPEVFSGLEGITGYKKPENKMYVDLYLPTLPVKHRPSFYRKLSHTNDQLNTLTDEALEERIRNHRDYYYNKKVYVNGMDQSTPKYVKELREFTMAERKRLGLVNNN